MNLERTIFETSRSAEYFNARELQAQTGQTIERFADVALKELADNALDACETAGVSPEVRIEVHSDNGLIRLCIDDNGNGIAPETVRRILNFQTRTSDKSAYRAPTRGLQGNALKTILGMPCALNVREPVILDAHGVRHIIRAWVDPAGELRIEHNAEDAPARRGTSVALALPSRVQEFTSGYWARAFSLFNPHASVKFCESGNGVERAKSDDDRTERSYRSTVPFPNGRWRKFLPTDLTSPYWYDEDTLARLIFSHIAETRRGGKDPTLREFVSQFRGLSGTSKAKAVCDQFPDIPRLSDLENARYRVGDLLEAMRRVTRSPSPRVLGLVGEEHFRACLDAWSRVRRFWYCKKSGHVQDIPFVFEAALAVTEGDGNLYCGVNFS